jgi:hypothetical protein
LSLLCGRRWWSGSSIATHVVARNYSQELKEIKLAVAVQISLDSQQSSRLDRKAKPHLKLQAVDPKHIPPSPLHLVLSSLPTRGVINKFLSLSRRGLCGLQ